jgi:hypothetical protein
MSVILSQAVNQALDTVRGSSRKISDTWKPAELILFYGTKTVFFACFAPWREIYFGRKRGMSSTPS